MARPQVEDGHVKVANELAEALARVNLSAYQSRIVWCVFRKTYGWNKKTDRISYSQFEETTHLNRRHIGRTLRVLIARKIITCQGDGQVLEYGIQKDYDQWAKPVQPLPKEAIAPPDSTIACIGNSELLPVEGEPLPKEAIALLPKEATKPLPKEANTKDKSNIKALDKRQSDKKRFSGIEPRATTEAEFREYIEETKAEFPDLDCEVEFKKFTLYWSEGKKKLQRPKTAWLNWLTKARQFQNERGNNGRTGTTGQSGRNTGPGWHQATTVNEQWGVGTSLD